MDTCARKFVTKNFRIIAQSGRTVPHIVLHLLHEFIFLVIPTRLGKIKKSSKLLEVERFEAPVVAVFVYVSSDHFQVEISRTEASWFYGQQTLRQWHVSFDIG